MKKQKQSVGKGGNYLAARKQHFVNTFEKCFYARSQRSTMPQRYKKVNSLMECRARTTGNLNNF